uniref:Uncharacterized protein n=1 Tax=uncultured Thiotrichaceae bacterium TaxID=298394 RepID=A0A6S6UA98_9GAMM|nr:MAG: Unknown protein [uncultured Thiotrichaceae bacterium]
MNNPELEALLRARQKLDEVIGLAKNKMNTEAAEGATQPDESQRFKADGTPVTMDDIQASTNIPSPNGVVAALQGKVGLESVVGNEFKDTTTPQSECFSLEAGEQIHAYVRDITAAFGKMMVEIAHKDRISRRVDGTPIQSIIEFASVSKNLLDLVHPEVLSDFTIDDKIKRSKE